MYNDETGLKPFFDVDVKFHGAKDDTPADFDYSRGIEDDTSMDIY